METELQRERERSRQIGRFGDRASEREKQTNRKIWRQREREADK